MAGFTLDTGVAIAIDRGDRDLWLHLVNLLRSGEPLWLPTVVIAQSWRGPRSARITALIERCRVVPLDLHLSRRAGELTGRAGTSDIVDAAVVSTAERFASGILTADSDDIRRLAAFAPRVGVVRDLRELRL